MKRFSEAVSCIFSPMIVPTYGMVLVSYLSELAALPLTVRWTTIAIVFVITCIIPIAGIQALYRTGYISDPALNNSEERSVPYIIAALCYLGCGFFLYRASAPEWFTMFYFGGTVAVSVSGVVNCKWKISAHAASMGGLVALMFRLAASHQAIFDLEIWLSVTVLLAGLVMTARVYLQRHTLMQVLAGAANGFLCVWIASMFC